MIFLFHFFTFHFLFIKYIFKILLIKNNIKIKYFNYWISKEIFLFFNSLSNFIIKIQKVIRRLFTNIV